MVKNFVVDYNTETFEPLMEHEVNGLDYKYVYGNDRLSVDISPINNSGKLIENGDHIRLYYHMDYLGSADYLTSPVSGKVEAWTHYNEWGLIVHNAVLKCGQRELDLVKRYATHDYDSVLELYYAKARFYDAHDRHFTAVDPILDPSQYDLREYVQNPVQLVQYLYTENNPINAVDYNGRSITLIVGTIIVVSALVGGTVSAGIDAYDQYSKNGEIDAVKVAIRFTEGAINGGLAASPIGPAWVIGGSAVTSAGASVLYNVREETLGEIDYTTEEIIENAVQSGVFSGAFAYIGGAMGGLSFSPQPGATYELLDVSKSGYIRHAPNIGIDLLRPYVIKAYEKSAIRNALLGIGLSTQISIAYAISNGGYNQPFSCKNNQNVESSKAKRKTDAKGNSKHETVSKSVKTLNKELGSKSATRQIKQIDSNKLSTSSFKEKNIRNNVTRTQKAAIHANNKQVSRIGVGGVQSKKYVKANRTVELR